MNDTCIEVIEEMDKKRPLGSDPTIERLRDVAAHCEFAFQNVNTCSSQIEEDIYLLLRAELHNHTQQARVTCAKFLMCNGNARLQHKADQYKVSNTAPVTQLCVCVYM